jgi:hypothetical protein
MLLIRVCGATKALFIAARVEFYRNSGICVGSGRDRSQISALFVAAHASDDL